MARTRLIHPDGPKDEAVASVSIWARYVWDHLPCYADREGRLEDKPFTLKLEILPTDDVDMDALLSELARVGLIIRYQIDNKRYIQIRTFAKHQNPHRNEARSEIPPPLAPLREPSRNGASAPVTSAAASECPEHSGDPVSDPDPDPVSDHPPSARARDPGGTGTDTAGLDDLPPVQPVDGYSLIHCVRVAVEREHPELGFWDKGPFAEREADEILEDVPPDKRPRVAERLSEHIDAFAKSRDRDVVEAGWSVKAFRKFLAKAVSARASPKRNVIRVPPNWPRAKTLGPPK